MSTCILVGTVSNVSSKIEADLDSVLNALSIFSEVKIFLVESDSSDSTNEVLKSIMKKRPDFSYISLGHLKNQYPDRIERIRFCRNEYVRYLRNIEPEELPDYVVVADLDGMNGKLTDSAVRSCFVRDDWDGVFSNQSGGYYDILALRHPVWQPLDYNIELEWYRSLIIPRRRGFPKFYESLRLRIAFDRARKMAVYRKMLWLSPSQPWIEVDSAFGGIGIYKAEIFLKYDYQTTGDLAGGVSEHVLLHTKMRKDGRMLFVNPSFINGKWNTYNVNRFLIIRQIRQLAWNSKIASRILSQLRRSV